MKEKKITKVKINILPIPKGPFTLDEISQETGCITYNKIGNISIHKSKTYSTWKSRIQSMSFIFENEMQSLF